MSENETKISKKSWAEEAVWAFVIERKVGIMGVFALKRRGTPKN